MLAGTPRALPIARIARWGLRTLRQGTPAGAAAERAECGAWSAGRLSQSRKVPGTPGWKPFSASATSNVSGMADGAVPGQPTPSEVAAPATDDGKSTSATKAYAFKRTYHRKRGAFIPVPPSPTAEEAVTNILYDTPLEDAGSQLRHILNCLVQDEPGVLSRISGILAGRGFNIDSLVVSRTEIPELSRMTIVLNGEHSVIEQARRQLEDLVPVWAVLDYTNIKLVERELLLVKVMIGPEDHTEQGQVDEPRHGEPHGARDATPRTQADPSYLLMHTHQRLHHLTELTRLFSGCILDVSDGSVIIELSAKTERVDAFLRLIKPFGIIESSRSGVMAMPRSVARAEVNEVVEDDDACAVDATMLPPG